MIRHMERQTWQRVALENFVRLGCECPNPLLGPRILGAYSAVLTVDAGYECLADSIYGGPVWHASASRRRDRQVAAYTEDLLEVCRSLLDGVGDATRGEWVEQGVLALHLRRRLTPVEDAAVGPSIDVRGTPEGAARMEAARRFWPPGVPLREE